MGWGLLCWEGAGKLASKDGRPLSGSLRCGAVRMSSSGVDQSIAVKDGVPCLVGLRSDPGLMEGDESLAWRRW
jgi:hypothetical protein